MKDGMLMYHSYCVDKRRKTQQFSNEEAFSNQRQVSQEKKKERNQLDIKPIKDRIYSGKFHFCLKLAFPMELTV